MENSRDPSAFGHAEIRLCILGSSRYVKFLPKLVVFFGGVSFGTNFTHLEDPGIFPPVILRRLEMDHEDVLPSFPIESADLSIASLK